MKIKIKLAAVLFFLLAADIWATDNFTFHGDRLSSVRAQGKEYTLLDGNAGITSSSTVISADTIKIYGGDNEYAECTGNVEVLDNNKGISLKASKLFFNRKDDIIRVEGSAIMEDMKNKVVVKGNFLEYLEQEEICLIQIGVRILKEDMACRSEFARYDRNQEILELSGMPVVYWKDDEYRALRIIIDIDKDEISLEGKVSGKIFSEEKKETIPVDVPAGEEGELDDGTGTVK